MLSSVKFLQEKGILFLLDRINLKNFFSFSHTVSIQVRIADFDHILAHANNFHRVFFSDKNEVSPRIMSIERLMKINKAITCDKPSGNSPEILGLDQFQTEYSLQNRKDDNRKRSFLSCDKIILFDYICFFNLVVYFSEFFTEAWSYKSG